MEGSSWIAQRGEAELLAAGAIFLLIYALALTLSPAARLRDWGSPLLWTHWIGYAVWLLGFLVIHQQLDRRLPDRDQTLLPIAATLVGWGLLTIYRVTPVFGLRQTVWIALAMVAFIAALRLPESLAYLRRYKYLWLVGGLLLTTATLLLGTNPTGAGPRLWLGCCGVYLQPSEPLKLLLIVFLAAYLAGRQFFIPKLLPLLAPTLILIGIAVGLMLVQRDLGTASILLILFVSVVYSATGKYRFLAIGLGILVLAGIAGYLLYDVIRIRVEAWINPWEDPIGRSYQIVQSLLAVSSGGMLGRGPGLGNPAFVPVQHSDFIFASIAEETGLAGSLGLLILLACLTVRGLKVALNAPDNFRRYLAVGLVVYLSAQSIVIIGGNLRLLPLTGVTLPFVSYGGSSLFTSMMALFFLITISNSSGGVPAAIYNPRPIQVIGTLLLSGIAALALVNGWWAFYRGPDLLTRTDNPRRALADLYVPRGTILDRSDSPLAVTDGNLGSYTRRYLLPSLAPVLGYVHPLYGLAGAEAAQDDYLRGLEGNPAWDIWWNHLLYGQPPPGLDVRQTLDQAIQQKADELLAGRAGALVLLNSDSGEILAMASHPSFDPNNLDADWEGLVQRQDAPLLNRAAQGQYPAQAALGPLLLAEAIQRGVLPESPGVIAENGGACAVAPADRDWPQLIASGCPDAFEGLIQLLGDEAVDDLNSSLGFFEAPLLQLPTAGTPQETAGQGGSVQLSPLQLAIAIAALNADGVIPAPRIASAVLDSGRLVTTIPPLGSSLEVFNETAAAAAVDLLAVESLPIWETVTASASLDGAPLTWYLAGTDADWQGTPLSMALILEADDPEAAQQIGREIIQFATR